MSVTVSESECICIKALFDYEIGKIYKVRPEVPNYDGSVYWFDIGGIMVSFYEYGEGFIRLPEVYDDKYLFNLALKHGITIQK